MICQKPVWVDRKSDKAPTGAVNLSPVASSQQVMSDSGVNLTPGTPRFASTPLGSPPTPPGRALTGGTPRRAGGGGGQQPLTLAATVGHDSGLSLSPPPLAEKKKTVFSKKVFVGGLPPDIDSDRIVQSFRPYGELQVGWPHKMESNAPFPPKGFAFLQFEDEGSVHRLIQACLVDGTGFYTLVSSPSVVNKPVQIRPWRLCDSECVVDPNSLDAKKTVFVGGVPRPLTALQLARLMQNLYGPVCYAGIDVDPELGYPKGAGRVVFKSTSSCIAAISARFVQIDLDDINKRVEVKPYILQDQPCEHCRGVACEYKLAPYFCANVACLLYLCIPCWAQIHSDPRLYFHKPLLQKSCAELHHADRQASHRQASHPWQ